MPINSPVRQPVIPASTQSLRQEEQQEHKEISAVTSSSSAKVSFVDFAANFSFRTSFSYYRRYLSVSNVEY